jgi:hypothetical protein
MLPFHDVELSIASSWGQSSSQVGCASLHLRTTLHEFYRCAGIMWRTLHGPLEPILPFRIGRCADDALRTLLLCCEYALVALRAAYPAMPVRDQRELFSIGRVRIASPAHHLP